jgi:uncharacterized hydrophobic protein (TIGR00271 family)
MRARLNCVAELLTVDAEYEPKIESKLFFEGPGGARAVLNFFVLLALATVIATYGVLSNSTATVVGAMVVAPLMTPIMATAAAMVMGNTERAAKSLLLVTTGAVGVIVISMALSFWIPSVAVSFSTNQEITSRVSPGLLALLVALASGAAGAFAVAREEISDALPGVAIAISLVPPLSVVGISLAKGEPWAAGGAALLFLTNCVAILLAGGAVLGLMRLGAAGASPRQRRARRWGFAIVFLSTLVITVPLALTARSVLRADVDQWRASSAVEEWLGDRPAELLSVSVSDSAVTVSIASAEQTALDQHLVDALTQRLGRPILVRLRIVSEQRSTPPG